MGKRWDRIGYWALAGLEGAIAAQAIMLAGRLLLSTPAAADAMADLSLRLMPGAVSGFILDRFQFAAKPALLIGLIAAQLVAGSVAGMIVGLWTRGSAQPTRRAWTGSGIAASVFFIFSVITFVTSGDLPSFIASARGGAVAVWLIIVASFAVFGVVLGSYGSAFALGQAPAATGPRVQPTGSLWFGARRQVLGGGFALLTILVTGGSLGQILARMGERGTTGSAALDVSRGPVAVETPLPAATSVAGTTSSTTATPETPARFIQVAPTAGTTPVATSGPGTPATTMAASPGSGIVFPPGITPLVTSVDDFYVVSKNFIDPEPDVNTWKLEITGMVDHPLSLTFHDVTALPTTTRYQTLECISNPIGGDLISNGQWTGVLFKDLFGPAGVKPGVTWVNFTALDGFTESLPLSEMLNGIAMLAHSLDGSHLTAKHGAPARLLTFSRYGMKQPKWIQKIELAASPITGFWEQQGWDSEAIVRTNTRIDVPRGGKVSANQQNLIAGIAFAGSRGIANVEVNADGGRTWGTAELEPVLAPSTWVRWVYAWTPTAKGNATLMTRATDGTGTAQPEQPADSFPKGPDGYAQASIQIV
jgi:DMSO/TMAO reductase YedYZ molybdopterin-dependent catalytic subunit